MVLIIVQIYIHNKSVVLLGPEALIFIVTTGQLICLRPNMSHLLEKNIAKKKRSGVFVAAHVG